jgi:pimeloyl-ACP methyl ester carboxylesterase
MWTSQIPVFSRTYRLILWDMRGHGQTSSPIEQAAYSEPATIEDMHALLTHLSNQWSYIGKWILGGLSLGGYMSLAFYARWPERVMGLLICDTGPGFRDAKARQRWNETAHATAQRFEREGLAALQSQSRERAEVKHGDVWGLVRAARGMLTQRDDGVMKSLPNVRVPMLVVVGENDTPFLGATEYMVRKVEGAKKVVIPGAGHAANMDNPEVFNREVERWLAELGGKARL